MVTKYWIGIATKDHVMAGVRGGFCQLGHGKHTPVARLNANDWIIYYAPRAQFDGSDKLQSFVALGQIQAREPYCVQMSSDFSAWRRDVHYHNANEARIRPLLDKLSFIDSKHWGLKFRRSLFEITHANFATITQAMNVQL
jgi:hypothetical protein